MPETRFEARKRSTHERLREAALELILDGGLDGFSMDDAASRADVSRATLFNHYGTKDDLVRAAVEPIFAQALSRIEALAAPGRSPRMSDVAAFCFDVWAGHRDRAGFADAIPGRCPFPSLSPMHDAFTEAFGRLVARVGESERLRAGDPALCTALILGCFAPALRAIGERPDAKDLFADCLASLALEDGGARRPGPTPQPSERPSAERIRSGTGTGQSGPPGAKRGSS